METLFKLFLGFVLLFLVVLVGAYFVVMRPGFQKNLIESRLPEGSSLKHVQITLGSVEVLELSLRLEDGTSVKLQRLNARFSPLAAVFDNTIQVEDLVVDGLLVELPQQTTISSSGESVAPLPADPKQAGATAPGPVDSTSGAPTEALYAIDQIDRLLDFDSMDLNGVFVDPARNRYTFTVSSGRIAPDTKTELEASLQLESKEALQGGLQAFSSDIRIQFTQSGDGGFEYLNIVSETQGSDASGAKLLSAAQTLELSVDGFEETAELDLAFNADLPRPEVFAPEMAALQGLSLQGDLQAAVDGEALTLNSADLDASANGAQVASVVLKQSLTLGAQQQFSGEIMDIALTNLPLAWVNPWLGSGLELSGAPLSAEISVSGEAEGGMQITSRKPIEMGPFSLSQYELPLLDNVLVRMNPVVRVGADGAIQYDLGDFQILDRYGDVVSGSLSGSKSPAVGSSPLSGLRTKARLQVGLSEAFNQPVLAGRASVLAGQARVQLDLDGAAEYPAKLQTKITGLRARDLPGSRQDYRLAAQLKQSESGMLSLGANFEAGSENRASTSVQLGGQVNPEKQPLPFKVNMTSSKVVQRDIDLLLAAFKPEGSGSSGSLPTSSSSTSVADLEASSPLQGSTQNSPPWAGLDGEVAIKIDALALNSGHVIRGLSADARISEPLLALNRLEASLEEGGLEGEARVEYNPASSTTYRVASDFGFENMDPAIFSKKASGSFPVQGRFNGDLQFVGSGATLESALDAAEGGLTITGRDGLLTAFELDNRSQLGLLGAGLLGQQFDRPGITAMAQAVPYFKDMRFENFTLKLMRGGDRQVRIPELSFLGDNVRIQGEGLIAASSLSEVLNQPLSLRLSLGAKGRLVEYLETLQLLGPDTSEDGFRNWKQDINIGGTLGDPDTSELQRILSDAARRAIRDKDLGKSKETEAEQTAESKQGDEFLLPGQGKPQVEEEPEKKSKEERLVDDIEMGLDLLNSVLGN